MIEKALGPESQATQQARNRLANLYYREKKYNDAEPFYQRVLAIQEKLLGAGQPDLVVNMENLARNYYAQGNVVEGDSLSRRARAIRMKDLLPESYESAKGTISHARDCANAGNLDGAEQLLRRHLAERENILDPDPPDVALILDNLADILSAKGGCYDEVSALRDRARAIWASYPDLESVIRRKKSDVEKKGQGQKRGRRKKSDVEKKGQGRKQGRS